MLKIYKLNERYFFVLHEIKKSLKYLGIEYNKKLNEFNTFDFHDIDAKKEIKKIDDYEIFFCEKNILNKINKKLKGRIKYLNSINDNLSRDDFLLIFLNQEIEKYKEKIGV